MRRGNSQELFTLERCRIVRESSSGAALLVVPEGLDDDDAEWVPTSQVRYPITKWPDGSANLTMTAWIAKEKGFI